MFANTFQSGFLSIFYSVGSSPLSIWDKQVKNGHIRRVVDDEVKSLVLEVSGTNVATTYITCPIKPRASLGIKLPFLVMIIKNMKKYFTFEIQILDDKDMHRRFRVSNFQSTTKVRPFCTTMPIGLSSGWNQIQFNLADFTKRAYGSTYIETTRVQIHANVRIRRVYFADMLYSDDEMPNEFKLFLPVPGAKSKVPQKDAPKKESISKEGEGEKKLSDNEMKIQNMEQEIPSGAPPSPADPTRRDEQIMEEAMESLPITEPQSTDALISPVTDESPPGDSESPVGEDFGDVLETKPGEGDEFREAGEAPAEAEAPAYSEEAAVEVAPDEGGAAPPPPEESAPEPPAPEEAPPEVQDVPVEDAPPAED